MCGICGFIESNAAKSAEGACSREQILESMMRTLAHRGPDQGKNWISGQAAFGFRRLSIIDLKGSVQPMTNEDGSLVLVFNGEIYNYQELRQELRAAGHHFHTKGDSEVLLHGYEEWGEKLPERLRGMFAFAIWNEEKGQLFAARDPFGIKPFYYTMAEGSFIFASEIKGILAHPAYKKRLNHEALEQYLSFQYSVLEETFFQGVLQLRPGSYLKYDENRKVPELGQYFVPKLQPESDRQRSETEWIDELDEVIKDSVKVHMAADVEVGTFLSGGVDSSLIAAEFTGKKAFTVGFGNTDSHYNEMPLARELAETLQLSHKGKLISEAEFWEAVPQVLYYMDEPSGDPSAVALYFLAGEAARQVKVVVSGEGADELFGGYRIYCEPNALRLYQRIPLFLRKGIAAAASRFPAVAGRSFLMRGSTSVEERFIGNANLFGVKERKRLLKTETKALSPQALLAGDYREVRDLDEASRMQSIDLRHWLPGDILQKADRMSMAHSLEVRVPYLDKEVFKTARRLPAPHKQRKQVSKYLFRQAAGRHLPAASSNRRKLGFPVPLGDFLTSETGAPIVEKAFHSKTAETFFHREVLDELLAGRGSGRGNTNRKIWAVYAFLTWYEVFFPEGEQ